MIITALKSVGKELVNKKYWGNWIAVWENKIRLIIVKNKTIQVLGKKHEFLYSFSVEKDFL